MVSVPIPINNRQTAAWLLHVLEECTNIKWASRELPTEYKDHLSRGYLVLNISTGEVYMTQERRYALDLETRVRKTDPSKIDYESILKGIASWYETIQESPHLDNPNDLFKFSLNGILRYAHRHSSIQKTKERVSDIYLPPI